MVKKREKRGKEEEKEFGDAGTQTPAER